MIGTPNISTPATEDFGHVDHGDQHVGRQLAHHQFQPSASGVTISCSIVPRSRSRTMEVAVSKVVSIIRISADQGRDHVVGGEQVGVVPDLCAHLDRHLGQRGLAAGRRPLNNQIRGLGLADHGGRRERGAGNGGVRTIDDQGHLRPSRRRRAGRRSRAG